MKVESIDREIQENWSTFPKNMTTRYKFGLYLTKNGDYQISGLAYNKVKTV